MTDDREPFREARAAGLKARQERRLENATYTAAEVKVLTEAALRLGRKEALEEAEAGIRDWMRNPDCGREYRRGLGIAARIVHGIPRAAPGATSEPAEPLGYSDLPQDSQDRRDAL